MTFWNFCEELAEAGDAGHLLESEFCDKLREREPYDMLIGDPMLTRAVPYKVEKVVAIPNLALSGMMFKDQSPILFGECGSKYFEMEFAKEEQ